MFNPNCEDQEPTDEKLHELDMRTESFPDPTIYLKNLQVFCNSDLFGDVLEAIEKNNTISKLVLGKNERCPEDRM